MRISTKLATLIVAFVLSFALTACGGGASNTSGGGGDPAKTTKDFFAAVFSGGDFKSFVCTSNAAAAEAMTKGFEQMRTTMTASGAKITTDKLTFTAGDVKDNATTVTVGGKMTATVSGNSVDTDFGPIKVPLKNEGGNWKICG